MTERECREDLTRDRMDMGPETTLYFPYSPFCTSSSLLARGPSGVPGALSESLALSSGKCAYFFASILKNLRVKFGVSESNSIHCKKLRKYEDFFAKHSQKPSEVLGIFSEFLRKGQNLLGGSSEILSFPSHSEAHRRF